MERNKKLLNWIFIVQLILFGLIVTGILPRTIVPYLAGALAIYVLFSSLEDATVFFVRSIPFFIAIPLTATFDNFNTWRILAAIIFLRWFAAQFSILNFQFPIKFKLSNFKISKILIGLLLLATLSIIPAPDKILAVKRIIYFLNLSLIGIVIYDLAQKEGFAKKLIKNITIPVIIVTIIGFIQLGSTYVMDIYQFMGFWAGKVQFNQFGAGWSYIAYNLGNTWYAYYGEQISLRMFSLFPDSHSFPQFILLGLPAIFAVFFNKKKILTVIVSTIYLAAILTGTRGIWAAGAGSAFLAILAMVWFWKTGINETSQKIFKKISLSFISFFALFIIAFPIFASPQFLLYKMDSDLLTKRVRSIINFGETSNKERIRIWKLSLESIKNHPFLGVGIGNFPIVLNQDLTLAKAGSSAHNIYLHIAAEMGIPALLLSLWFLWVLIQKIYNDFAYSKDREIIIYSGAVLIFVPWVLAYCLTDVALFDERAFLLFVTTVALIFGTKKPA